MEIKRVGLDLAKRVIRVHAVDFRERLVCRRALKRDEVLSFFRDRVPCPIGMEACAQAHDWGRRLTALGHTVKLIAGQHVKPYVQGQKNDRNDAAAICEAVSRPGMRFVPVKSHRGAGRAGATARRRQRRRTSPGRTGASGVLIER